LQTQHARERQRHALVVVDDQHALWEGTGHQSPATIVAGS
jgi:hypothetical protein